MPQLARHQQELDAFYATQAGPGFWLDKYKPYLSLYRDRLVRRNAAIAAALPEQAGRILDLGCGRGDLMHQLEPRTTLCLGSDLAFTMADATRRNLQGRERVQVFCCPAETLPLRDESLEVIILADVVEHLLDVGVCLRECRRVLTAGGRVVITTPHARMEHFWQRADRACAAPVRWLSRRKALPPVHEHFYSPPELAALGRSAGFTVLQHELIEFYPGAEGGGNFGRVLRLIARQRHLRGLVVEPVFRTLFHAIERLRIFNNRQLLVLQKPAAV